MVAAAVFLFSFLCEFKTKHFHRDSAGRGDQHSTLWVESDLGRQSYKGRELGMGGACGQLVTSVALKRGEWWHSSSSGKTLPSPDAAPLLLWFVLSYCLSRPCLFIQCLPHWLTSPAPEVMLAPSLCMEWCIHWSFLQVFPEASCVSSPLCQPVLFAAAV